MFKKAQREYNSYCPFKEGHNSQPLPQEVTTRYANLDDAAAIARLATDNNIDPDLDYAFFLERTKRELYRGGNVRGFHIIVAIYNGEVVGYGRSILYTQQIVKNYRYPSPVGWYLMGVTVSPKYRGMSVGKILTKKRLDHIGQVATKAYYVVNEENSTSIKLHKSFGFKLLKKGPGFLKVKFNNNAGMLFECDLSGKTR